MSILLFVTAFCKVKFELRLQAVYAFLLTFLSILTKIKNPANGCFIGFAMYGGPVWSLCSLVFGCAFLKLHRGYMGIKFQVFLGRTLPRKVA